MTDPTGKQRYPDHPEGGTGGDGTPGRQCGNEPTDEDYDREEKKREEARRQEEQRKEEQRLEDERRRQNELTAREIEQLGQTTGSVLCLRAGNGWVIAGCEVINYSACAIGRMAKEREEKEEEEERAKRQREDTDEKDES